MNSEWDVNIQRDSYASYIGLYPLLAYFSVAENESLEESVTILCRSPNSNGWRDARY